MRVGSLVVRVVAAPVQVCLLAAAAPTLAYTLAQEAALEAAQAIERGRLMLARAALLLDAVELLVAEISVTSERAAQVVASADVTAVDAAGAVSIAEAQIRRVEVLLEACTPVLVELQPVLSRAGQTLQPSHVAAITQLLDLTPEVLDLIAPALRGMGDLTPEIDQLAERLDAVGQIVEGIPGAGLLKRRGAEEAEAAR